MKYRESAFPIFCEGGITSTGMTLRDYFAGQVSSECIKIAWTWHEDGGVEYEDIYKEAANMAYKFADAMITEREADKKEPVPEDILNDLLNMSDDRMKSIFERVKEKYPDITKKEILFKFTLNELFEILGEEYQEENNNE